jgi:hypothetical protein
MAMLIMISYLKGDAIIGNKTKMNSLSSAIETGTPVAKNRKRNELGGRITCR